MGGLQRPRCEMPWGMGGRRMGRAALRWAASLLAGMMLGGGCGQELAHWIVHGRPEKDMYGYDIRQVHPAPVGRAGSSPAAQGPG